MQSEHRYGYLDGWRGLSIMAVLLGHFFAVGPVNTGRLGVEMFFVLSGRLMAEILFIKQVPLVTFLKRRVSRVWPALMIFILIVTAIFHFASGTLFVSGSAALSALTFTYNYAQLWMPRSHVLDHLWSLCIEEHIYILLACMAFLCRRYALSPAPMLLALSLLFMLNGMLLTWDSGAYTQVYWRSDVRGASILISAAIFLIVSKARYEAPAWLPVAAVMTGVLLNLNVIPDPVKYSIGSTLIAIGVCTLQRLPQRLLMFVSHRALQALGLISFSLYLWQQPLYKLYEHGHSRYLMLAAALVLACLSYRLIEVPARRYLNASWAKPT